jgi:alkanesulfonate monooxygenase SsuD/methylene tetrahydromethanopterin reductase-like flavin-dependent oxidoreductase (luciferase family)
MKLGIFFEPMSQNAPADTYDLLLEQAITAESLGFATAWIAGHEFPLAAALAEVTEYIRVGVLAKPVLEHPLKAAEDGAVLDLASNGRLLFGIDPSIAPEELDASGIPSDQCWPRFIEATDVIVKSWTHDSFAYLGEYNRIPLRTNAVADDGQPFIAQAAEPPFVVPWRRAGMPFDYVSLQPKPLQMPHPPVFVAAADLDSARWAAHMGYSLLLGAGSAQTPASACAMAYWEELAKSGRRRDEVTLAIALELEVFENNASAGQQPVSDAGLRLSGTPEQVLEGIKSIARDTGAFHVLCRISAQHNDPTAVARSLHLLASEVRPRLEM